MSFVGSSGVAEYIYKTASAHGKRVQAFGAAKNHAIVMPDADLDATVNAIMGGAFWLRRRALHGAAGGGGGGR
ncbi:Methylmalonate-semialdehyde dehydrogenase [inositol] [Klebsiella pneumoniae IS39]|nr:Methylmalonate-semialdehyde dehydrogenase [inositol] [Klebsiella pneumoniae IS39]